VRLEDKPNLANYVAIVHHQDARKTWWGIEARPGGVGYVDMTMYLSSGPAAYANSNARQDRTDEQRALVAKGAEGMIGVGYPRQGERGALHAGGLVGLQQRRSPAAPIPTSRLGRSHGFGSPRRSAAETRRPRP
jgi:hypothetical protein